MTTLLMIGAGPKSIATAAKIHVLDKLGIKVPQVKILEKERIAHHWVDKGGWTDGMQLLGTSPCKDVGYPYRTSIYPELAETIDREMLQFSWPAFLLSQGLYMDWVDRDQPHPTHTMWSQYLQWVCQQIKVPVHYGEVISIDTDGSSWTVATQDLSPNGGITKHHGDGLLVTGFGDSDNQRLGYAPGVLSVADFWKKLQSEGFAKGAEFTIVGAGEMSASITQALSGEHSIPRISIISPRSTVYTRGEGFFENRMYSNAHRWSELPLLERKDFISRTDRGVFSARSQTQLLGCGKIDHIRGKAVGVKTQLEQEQYERIRVLIEIEHGKLKTHVCDYVVDAAIAKPLWFADLLTQKAKNIIKTTIGGPINTSAIELKIDRYLKVGGLDAQLFIPNLGALMQGPGFPNLSCLGTLSDRVISTYIDQRYVLESEFEQGNNTLELI